MDMSAGAYGNDPSSVTSLQHCVTVTAEPCEVTPSSTFTGVLNNDNLMMTYSQSASYTMNTWCDKDLLVFDYSYQYMNQPWEDAASPEDGDYHTALAANQTTGSTWQEQESDYEITTLLKINYPEPYFPYQAPFE